MGFDGCVVPEFLRPYVDWVTGMAWPEGDPQRCFRMADACVATAHRVVAGTAAADPATARLVGDAWDGDAQQAFVAHVQRTVGGRQADLVKKLIDAAIALNAVGVTIQHAQRMITLIVVFLIVALPLLLWQAPWLLRPFLQITRMSALQIAMHTLRLMAAFAVFGGGMDFATQLSQVLGGRRDDVDVNQLLVSLRDGAINGLLTGLLGGGLGRLATPALRAGVARAEAAFGERLLAALTTTMPGQMAQYGIAGSATTAISLALDGKPLDWDLILKSGTSAALGADGQHLLAHVPGHVEGGGAPPAVHPDGGPPPGSPRRVLGPADGAITSLAQTTPEAPTRVGPKDHPGTPGLFTRTAQADIAPPPFITRPEFPAPVRGEPAAPGPRTPPAAPARVPAGPPHRAVPETASGRGVPESHGTRAAPETGARQEGPSRQGGDRTPIVEGRRADDSSARPNDLSPRRAGADEVPRPARPEPSATGPRRSIDDLINRPLDPPADRPATHADGSRQGAGTHLADGDRAAPQPVGRASGDGSGGARSPEIRDPRIAYSLDNHPSPTTQAAVPRPPETRDPRIAYSLDDYARSTAQGGNSRSAPEAATSPLPHAPDAHTPRNRIDESISRPPDQVGRSQPSNIPPHPGHRPLPPELARAFEGFRPEEDGHRLTGGVSARSVTSHHLSDRSHWVHKVVERTGQADAEVLGSVLGEAIGANVPPIYRLDPHTIVMPFIGDGTALGFLPAPTTLAAKLLGLLHVLAVDGDANRLNIILDEHGEPWGIDMSGSFEGLPPQYVGRIAEVTISPFADHWVSRDMSGYIVSSFEYIPNELSRSDVVRLSRQIQSVRPYFEGLGRGDWFAGVWKRWEKIAENASATTSIFDQE
ncbi:WXG100-like domain-containing protein [Nonomuraea sp. NPDC003727]